MEQKRNFGDAALYDILVRGNEIADTLAKMATQKDAIKCAKRRKKKQGKGKHRNTRDRDWAAQPTAGTDSIYLTVETETPSGLTNVWIDGKIHAWIREDTQKKMLIKRVKQAKAGVEKRTQYLAHLDIIDPKRSLTLQSRSRPHTLRQIIQRYSERACTVSTTWKKDTEKVTKVPTQS